MKLLFLLLRGGLVAAIVLLAGCSTTVAGPDGGVVSVSTPPGPALVVDPPGPAGIAIGGP
jgi:hypothetical protein